VAHLLFDLDGKQGLLGQVQGRTADDAAYWLAGATPAWRDAVQVVCIDMCSIYAAAVRRMLPPGSRKKSSATCSTCERE
jgi:transposase